MYITKQHIQNFRIPDLLLEKTALIMREKTVDEKKSLLLSRLRGTVLLSSLLFNPEMKTQ